MARINKTPVQSSVISHEIVMDMAKQTKFKAREAITAPNQEKHASRGGWFVGIGLVIILCIGLSLSVWWYLTNFEASAKTSAVELLNSAGEGLKTNPFANHNSVNLLLLGLDTMSNRSNEPPLTDTIMVVSIHQDGRITFLSIPRDLWIDTFKVKVNALYSLGQQTAQGDGILLVKNVITDITGEPIDYVMTTQTAALSDVVDAIGGIKVMVPHTFEDDMYPNPQADITSTDPKVLYQTIKFVAGSQTFDGLRTVQYVRSRHSADLTQGNDVARNERQQTVIEAIWAAIPKKQLLVEPTMAGKLYHIYKTEVSSDLSNAEMVGLGKNLIFKKITFINLIIPEATKDRPGIIQANPKNSYNQWVFEPVDPTWQALKEFVSKNL